MPESIVQGRRTFLKNCAFAGVTTSLVAPHLCEANGLTRETFAEKIGDKFLVRTEEEGEMTYVRLKEAKALRETKAGYRKPFSLLFEADAGVELQQDVYHVTHRELGQLRLLLVPVSPKGKQKLEAVFC